MTGIVGVLALVAGALSMWAWTAHDSRAQARRVGELEGERDALKRSLAARDRQIEALEYAVAEMRRARPTLGELARVSGKAAGDAARPDAADSIEMP